MKCALAFAVLVPVLATLPALPGPSPSPDASAESTGTLTVHVALVASDLSVKAVPKSRFLLRPEPLEGQVQEIATGFDGSFQATLSAGRYRVVSVEPVELEGKRFSWNLSFEVVEGRLTSLELSNDNATVEGIARRSSTITEEGAIYQRLKSAVVKIISDSSRGSGFLVSTDGLMLTNHHVVADSAYLAARFEDGRKHALRLLAEDPRHDIAVVQVHPSTVHGLAVPELSDDGPDSPQLAVGQRVLAIGSALSTESLLTSGLVSKIDAESIYSDVDINPGNSGGPLLDLEGRVVGITTFGLGGEVGPGVAGIVRIHLARPLIQQARSALASTDPPSERRLPEAATYRFSPEEVKQLANASKPKVADYHVEAGKFDVQLITPVLATSEMLRRENEAAAAHEKRTRKKGKAGETQAEQAEKYEPGRGYYEWQKNSENFRPTVLIRVYPEIKIKTGSAFVAAMTGTGAKFRFKADFDRMELWRDNELIEPIHPGRMREVVNVGDASASMKDIGYFGIYEYPPEAFRDGAALKLKVWMKGDQQPIVTSIDPLLAQRVYRDFTPYFQHLDG